MKLMGATVIPLHSGSSTLKRCLQRALRDWAANYETATTCSAPPLAPPLPTIVREFQKMIGEEAKAQCLKKERLARCGDRLRWRRLQMPSACLRTLSMSTSVRLIGIRTGWSRHRERREHGAPSRSRQQGSSLACTPS